MTLCGDKKIVKLAELLMILLLLFSCNEAQKNGSSPSTSKPAAVVEVPIENQCAKCHQKEVKSWKESHHFKAMAEATNETVLGDFNNQIFINPKDQKRTRFFKKGGDFYAETQGPDGKAHEYKILYTYGFKPLQQYIVAFPNGRMQCLHVAWDTEKKKWYHLYPDTKVDHSEWLHWSRGGQNWNSMCADCHSTYIEKKFDEKTGGYKTSWENLTVSCQACHEGVKEHLNWQKKKLKGQDPIKSLKSQTSTQAVDQCAACHSRRQQLADHKHEDFQSHYIPDVLREPIYHADGQIRDEVYVYGSFLQSKMYKHGVSCKNCHDVHSNKLLFEGNKLCAQCHDTKKYDQISHHFHKVGTEGAQCVSCHMPGKHYMVTDFRRDHSLRIPRPDLSLKHGTPNACQQCHAEKGDQWAADAVKKHFGEKRPKHFSEDFLAVRDNPAESKRLYKVLADPIESPLVKATALWWLETYLTEETYNWCLRLMKDKSPMLQVAAIRLYSRFPDPRRKEILLPLLKDKSLSVRVETVFAMAEVQLSKEELLEYKPQLDEFYKTFSYQKDFAAGRLRLAQWHYRRGDTKQAESEYQKSIEIDSFFNTARIELAQLYRIEDRLPEAQKILEKVIKIEPKYQPAYKQLALTLVGQKKFNEAEKPLKTLIKMNLADHEAYYYLAVIYQNMNKKSNSERAYRNAIRLNRDGLAYYQGLMSLLIQHNDKEKARGLLIEMKSLFPKEQQYIKEVEHQI